MTVPLTEKELAIAESLLETAFLTDDTLMNRLIPNLREARAALRELVKASTKRVDEDKGIARFDVAITKALEALPEEEGGLTNQVRREREKQAELDEAKSDEMKLRRR